MSKKVQPDNDILTILGFLLIAIILFFVLFGNEIYKYINRGKGQSKEEQRKQLEKEYFELSQKIEKNVELKRKLDKKFFSTYLGVRIFVFVVVISLNIYFIYINYSLYAMPEIINQLVNIYGIFAILIGLILFLVYGNFDGIKIFINFWKKEIKKQVYKNHKNIEGVIKSDISKRDLVETKLKKFQGNE